jgi:putative ABC transport system permease protein
VGVLVRKRELAAMESIGMTRGQTRAMLKYEGAGYAVISLLLALTAGSAVTYGFFALFRRQAEYAVFTYPVLPVFVTALLIITICLVTPETVYRSVRKASAAERLRDAE